MGILVYLDEGEQVGLDEQPFWYGGLLYVFNMGRNQLRADLNAGDQGTASYARFDDAVTRLSSAGGGLISIYYHPTEFVTTEFWDAVNFANGAMPERKDWVRPRRRTSEDSERCFHVLQAFVKHMKQTQGVRFVTARDLVHIYDGPLPVGVDSRKIAEHLSREITFLDADGAALSAADMLIQLLGLKPQVVDGPTAPGITTWPSDTVPALLFERAGLDAADFIRRNHRLPNQVFLGAETLSLSDFTATLAGKMRNPVPGVVHILHGRTTFERYFSTDAKGAFNWPIHPAGFAAPELLDLGRLQGWTLKPAKLRESHVNTNSN